MCDEMPVLSAHLRHENSEMNLQYKLTFLSTGMNFSHACQTIPICIRDAQWHEKPPQPESPRSNSSKAKQSLKVC